MKDQLESRLVRPEAQQDCAFIVDKDPFKTLEEKFGEKFAEYRRQWEAASSFQLETPYPSQLDWELNNSCNLRCPMCTWSVEKTHGEGSKSWFPFDKFKEIITDGVPKGLKALDMSYVNEPLIRKDLPEFIQFARQAGILDIGLNTNAMLLTADYSRRLIASGITRLQFSLDAFSKEAYDKVRVGGDYERVMSNVLRFLEIRKEQGVDLPLVAVSFVKQRDNEQDLDGFVEFWEGKVDYLLIREYLTPVLPGTAHYEDKSKMFSGARHTVDDFKCTKPWQRLVVRHDGTLLPCCTFQGAFLPVGNLNGQSIEEVWTSPKMRGLREMHRLGQFRRNKICEACALSSTVNQLGEWNS